MAEEKSVTVSDPWFGKIESGEKKIEARLDFGFFSHLKEGDEIRLSNQDKTKKIKCIVSKIERFKTFHDLLDGERLKDVLPGIETIKEGLEILNRFYQSTDVEKNGVVAFTLKVESSKSGGRARSKSKSKTKKKSKSRSRSRSKGRSRK
jgi:ASC-1-like (ASCH) protein